VITNISEHRISSVFWKEIYKWLSHPALKMDVICSPETLEATYKTTWRHNLGDHNPRGYLVSWVIICSGGWRQCASGLSLWRGSSSVPSSHTVVYDSVRGACLCGEFLPLFLPATLLCTTVCVGLSLWRGSSVPSSHTVVYDSVRRACLCGEVLLFLPATLLSTTVCVGPVFVARFFLRSFQPHCCLRH
jgi:hypothetical protein